MKKLLCSVLCLALCLTAVLALSPRPVLADAPGDPCPMDVPTGPCPGHLRKVVDFAGTCVEPESYRLVCDYCGYSDGIPYNGSLGAHEYDELTGIRLDPTCTASGTRFMMCRNCKHQETVTIPALGHANVLTSSVEPTCTEEGRNNYRCSRCGITETETLPALGHDYVPDHLDPTCTAEGYDLQICSRCGDEIGDFLPPLGHVFELSESIDPTCTEEGKKTYYCSVCSEKETETVPPIGHSYKEDDWETEKEPTIFHEGIKAHDCTVCGTPEEEPIPKKSPWPLIIAGGGTAGAGIGIYFLLAKEKAAEKAAAEAARKAAEEAAEKAAEEAARELGKPSMQVRNVLLSTQDEDFVAFLKINKYINAKTCDVAELETGIEENEPHVIILDLNQSFTLDDFAEFTFEDQHYAFIVSDKVLPDVEEQLKKLKEDEKIVGYAARSSNEYVKLVKLFLPVAKPELTTDEGLDNIAMVADAMGIPLVSNIIAAYESTRDIKSTLEDTEGRLEVTDAAVIVSDIASILGFDKVAGVAGLVDDIATIKDTVTSEKNAVTVTDGYDAGADIVDVVGDLISK